MGGKNELFKTAMRNAGTSALAGWWVDRSRAGFVSPSAFAHDGARRLG